VKVVPKLPALYICKDYSIYMAMDVDGPHKNLASLALSPCELLGFNVGEIQRSGVPVYPIQSPSQDFGG